MKTHLTIAFALAGMAAMHSSASAQEEREAPPVPAGESKARSATTNAESEWARRIQLNYPAEALRLGLQGTVGVRVEINELGRVWQCLVTSSSGHPILDQAACGGMVRYARFNPALDAEGNPTNGAHSRRIIYSLGDDDRATYPRSPVTRSIALWARQIQMNYPAMALREELQGTVGVRVEVNPQGRVARCFVTFSSGHDILDNAACLGMLNFAIFYPALDDNGDPTTGTYSTRVTYRLNDDPLPQGIPIKGEGREVIAAVTAADAL